MANSRRVGLHEQGGALSNSTKFRPSANATRRLSDAQDPSRDSRADQSRSCQANVSKRGIYDLRPGAPRVETELAAPVLLRTLKRLQGARISERVMSAYRRIVLASRPVGAPALDNFR